MLTLDGLTIVQGDFRLEASLVVDTGARVAIVGPSGGGKSTLLSVIAGFLPPASGRVLWDDRDLAGLTPGDRPLTILFQDNNLFPHLTALENAGLGIRPTLRLSAEETARVRAALAKVGLAGLEMRKPAALSGGQQSRVALARVLLRDRPLLLLDEPFSALGPALKREMLALVEELAAERRLTVLMVSHDPEDARAFAPQTIVVAGGRAHAPRPTAEVLDDPRGPLGGYL